MRVFWSLSYLSFKTSFKNHFKILRIWKNFSHFEFKYSKRGQNGRPKLEQNFTQKKSESLYAINR